jgi:hypothetical protein
MWQAAAVDVAPDFTVAEVGVIRRVSVAVIEGAVDVPFGNGDMNLDAGARRGPPSLDVALSP